MAVIWQVLCSLLTSATLALQRLCGQYAAAQLWWRGSSGLIPEMCSSGKLSRCLLGHGRPGGTWMDCCLRSYFLPHADAPHAEVHYRIFGTHLRLRQG